MTEAEWLACTDPTPLLEFLRGRASDRKLRLFACACCRESWRFLTEERSRQAVEAAERFADGQVTQAELAAARAAAETARAEANARADDAMRAMNHGDHVYYAALRAKSFAAGAAVGSATDPAGQAAASAAENFVRAAAAQCVSNLEAVWWGWDDPDAAAEQAAVEADARQSLCALIRHLFGNPIRRVTVDAGWLAWDNGTVTKLAQSVYDERAFDRLPILGDALEEAGCTNADVLAHCRGPGRHVRGCWVLDLLLGKG